MSFLRVALFALVIPYTLANSCGIKGYDRGTEAYSYKSGSSVANYASCSAKCAASTKCKSFAVGAGACLLYSKTV